MSGAIGDAEEKLKADEIPLVLNCHLKARTWTMGTIMVPAA